MFDFIRLGFIDIIDILSVAVIIFLLIRWIRRSSAMNIFLGIMFLVLLRVGATLIGMKMLSSVLGTVLDIGVIALVIIFQPEIRHFLFKLGSERGIVYEGRSRINKLFGIKKDEMGSESINELCDACMDMAEQKVGALIVIPQKDSIEYIIETGDRVDAKISHRLIENIFFKNSPMHDGAMILGGDRIVAARCTLPITRRSDIPANYGMRHKAAIGMSEESDVTVIVVSEQTGRISFVSDGKIQKIKGKSELKLALGAAMEEDEQKEDADKQ